MEIDKMNKIQELAIELQKLTLEEQENLKFHISNGQELANGPDSVVETGRG